MLYRYILSIVFIFLLSFKENFANSNFQTEPGDFEKIQQRDYIPSGGFHIVDLHPDMHCDGLLEFEDKTVYDGEISYLPGDTYWLVKGHREPYIDHKLQHVPKLNREKSDISIGLYVTVKNSDGTKTRYFQTVIETKTVYKTPSIKVDETSSNLLERCVNSSSFFLDFGRSIDMVIQVDTLYSGNGVSRAANGYYKFDPAEAGVGVHVITFTARSRNPENTCEISISREIKVVHTPDIIAPDEIVINTSQPSYKVDMPVKVIANYDDRDVTYRWEPSASGNIDDPTIPNPTILVGHDMAYSLTVTAKKADNPFHCESQKTIILRLVPCIGDIRPTSNFLTPNGDGVNDKWVLQNIEKYDDVTVKIYNRAGQLIWSSKGYQVPWDGTHKGGSVIPGTYFYVIEVGINSINKNDKCPTRFTGFIQVIK